MNKSITKWLFSALFMLAGFTTFGQTLTPSASTLSGCENEVIQFFANAPGATSYTWDFGDKTPPSTSNNKNPTFAYPTAGTYTVTLTVDRNGTTSSAQLLIQINPLPKFRVELHPQVVQCFSGNEYCFTLYADDSLCGTRIPFTDGELIVVPPIAKGDSFKFCKKFTINSSQRTSYDMTVEATSCNGCTKKVDFLKIADVLPRIGLSFWSNEPRGCDSVRATFINTSFVQESDVERFIWIFGDGTVDSTNWANSPDTLVHWFRSTGPLNGNFRSKLFVQTKSGCSDTFIFNASATNFVIKPRIIANKDSACLDESTIDFELINGPPKSTLTGGWMWNFGDNLMDMVCSGCNYNNSDYPEATRQFGGLGPFLITLAMNHNICGTITVSDTIQIIGPSTVMEDPPNGILIAQNHRYQCVIQDTVQFTNLSTFYHNDNNFPDDDSAYLWSHTDTFEMLWGEWGYLNDDGDELDIFTKTGGAYTYVRTRYLPPNQRFDDGQLVHHFMPDQKAYEEIRNNDCVIRIWDFDDVYAPECTTNTRGNINVGKNCAFSMDSLPQHWYTPWDTILAYDMIRPLSMGVFNEVTRACSRRNVWYSDSNAIIRYISPFDGTDTLVEVGTAGGVSINNDSLFMYVRGTDTVYVPGNDFVKFALVPKADSLTLDTIPLAFYKPGSHILVKKEPNSRIQPADTVDPVLYRTLFYNTTARCNNVELQHFDTCHPFMCESKATASLALTPPRSKGVRWSGIRCLAPPSPPYGIVFNVQNTKPGCSQDHLEFNFDSASGINNWTQMIGGLFPGSAPPPPPLPVMPYVPQGTFPTSFVYLYTANNITDVKNGWVTVGTVVGNGITTTKPCYDTTFYHRMLKFRFANAAYTITDPVPRAQNDKAACTYQDIYFKMNSLTQPDVEVFSWTWGDGERHIETKKSYDTAQQMKKYFCDRINNIEKYITDTADLGGRLSPFAAYQDSIKRGLTTARTYSSHDSLLFNLKLTYHRDSIKKWLADPNTLIGWNVIERQINDNAIDQQNKGLPYTSNRSVYDTFLTSLVTDYKVNTIIAPEITPLIIDIFEQLGFDYFDIPSDQISKFFGPPGSGRCIDTTGYSNFISFEYEESSPAGIKRFSTRDTNINCVWKHDYKVSGIHSPLVLTRTRVDGCVQISSLPIKVGFGKEVCFSDTILCKNKILYGLANYWYWSTLLPWEITDQYDYWRDGARLIVPKELPTRWDWNLGDGKDYVLDNDYSGIGLNSNPPGYSRYRPSGPGAGITIKRNLTSGMQLAGPPSTIYYQTAGVFELGILAQDSNGCRDTTKQKIYVTDVTANFGFDQNRPQCKTILELLDSSFTTDGCVMAGFAPCDSIMEWIVDWGDGSPIGGKNNTNRNARLGHDYTRNGTFTVKLIVKTLLGCSDTFERILVVPGPKPVFEPLSLKICAGQPIQFANKSINPTSSATWIMDYGDGVTEDDTMLDTFTHVYNKPGIYNVFLTQFDSIPSEGKFCFAIYPDTTNGQQALITVEVVALDSTNVWADDTTVCIDQIIQFANTTPNTANKWKAYKWIFDIDNTGGDSLTRTDSTIMYAYRTAGVYRATVVPEYQSTLPLPHCPYRDTITIYVDSVKADFLIDTTETPKMCFTNTSHNGFSYRWWFDYKDSMNARMITNSAEQSIETDPCFVYDSVGCFFVVLETTSPDGCQDTMVKRVCNNSFFDVELWNTFTPGSDGNGDGLNDVFDLPIVGHDFYEITIFNRYGTKVFFSEDADKDWNGKLFNTGPEVAAGNYYYTLKYRKSKSEEEPTVKYGNITLLRE